jgi:hypothetical protein
MPTAKPKLSNYAIRIQYRSRVADHGDTCLAYPKFASLKRTTFALYDLASISDKSIACEDKSLWTAPGTNFASV